MLKQLNKKLQPLEAYKSLPIDSIWNKHHKLHFRRGLTIKVSQYHSLICWNFQFAFFLTIITIELHLTWKKVSGTFVDRDTMKNDNKNTDINLEITYTTTFGE